MANNTNVIGIKSEIKTDSEKGDINSINSAAEIMAVLEVQYLQNSQISKIRSATKNHLESKMVLGPSVKTTWKKWMYRR